VRGESTGVQVYVARLQCKFGCRNGVCGELEMFLHMHKDTTLLSLYTPPFSPSHTGKVFFSTLSCLA